MQETIHLGIGPTDVLLGAEAGDVVVRELQIYKDIYYLSGPVNSNTKDLAEPGSGYFVLGDNPPVSIDSRQFGPINPRQILGRVEVP